MPLYLTAAVRLASAILFPLAAIAAIRRLRTGSLRPRTVLLAPIVIVALVGLMAFVLQDARPKLIDADGMHQLVADSEGTERLIGITPLAVTIAVATVLLMLAAAPLFRTVYVGRGPVSDGFLAVGLAILAFAELQAAFYPERLHGARHGVGPGPGSWHTACSCWASARSSAPTCGRCARHTPRLTGCASRRPSARRWRSARTSPARSTTGWHSTCGSPSLGSSGSRPPCPTTTGRSRPRSARLDSATVEARQALVTMRTSLDAELPLSEMLKRTVDDFGQRSGIRVTFSVGAGMPTALPPRQQHRGAARGAGGAHERAQARRRDRGPRPCGHPWPGPHRQRRGQRQGLRPQRPRRGPGAPGHGGADRGSWAAPSGTASEPGGTTVELTVPMLVPEWLPTVTGSAAETAAEVVEDGFAAADASPDGPRGGATGPEPLSALATAVESSRSSS
ncbi:MAG: hypothetical protein R3C32_05165 [Chloroflexota bacterium]